VEFKTVAVAFGQALDALKRWKLGPCLVAEGVATAVLEAPNAKGELVVESGGIIVGRHRIGLHVK
jgi:hypothetical protein